MHKDPRPASYTAIVAVCCTVVFFSNLPIYGGLFLWGIQPIHFLALLFVAMVPACLPANGLRIELSSPYVLWCLGYLAISCISYAFVAPGPIDPIKNRAMAIAFMLATFILFHHDRHVTNAVRWSLVPCVILGCMLNVYHFTHPFDVIPADSELVMIGRAAGFYVNPNQSAAALILGLILTIELIRPSLRVPYVVLVLIGVALTVSRAGIALIVLLMAVLPYARQLRWGQVLAMLTIGIGAAAIMAESIGALLGDVQIEWAVILDRLDWFSQLGERADYSQNERAILAEKAFELFAANPFLGAGVGSTEVWSERTSAHNWYLMALADFGILGLLIFPLLVVACVGGVSGLFRRRNLAFVVFTLSWAMVSHNIVGEYFFMIAMSLMAAMSAQKIQRADMQVSEIVPLTAVPDRRLEESR